ncbi:DUF6615 family protein [Catellatospora paridis]|uniref:DUF6615 family protein n=1 Tax=Catellatospora paridis TaxID=1617086 RepID=UPI0012D41DD9|nr:DUF6615 family protein [Catellatospora paridis]
MTRTAREKARTGMLKQALSEVFLDRAMWVHQRVTDAGRARLDLHEETITQDLLLDISLALPMTTVRSFTRRQEARTGADWQWEWWFGGSSWFGMRVQAKRLKRLKDGTVGYDLGYRTGRSKSRQVDALIADARQAQMQAVYVLYNGRDLDVDGVQWNCKKLRPSAGFFGVSLLPASVARLLANVGTVDWTTVAQYSVPWSCLFDCGRPMTGCAPPSAPSGTPGGGRRVPVGLAHRAARTIERLERAGYESLSERLWAAPPTELNAEEQRFETMRAALEAPVTPHAQPPRHIRQLLEAESPSTVRLPSRVGAVTVFNCE